MSIHNVLDQLRAANAMGGGVGESLTMSGLDSMFLAASDIDINATSRLDINGAIVDIDTGTGTGISIVGNNIDIGAASDSVVVGHGTQGRVGFYGATPVTQPASTITTSASALISATAPSAQTSAINSTSNTSATVGFSSLNNFRTTIRAISQLQVQMTQVLNALSDVGLTA